MLNVSFINCGSGTDLIVSFAIATDNLYGVESLTLLRTPKYEMFLYPHERGVHLSYEGDARQDDDEYEMLKSIQISAKTVQIETDRRTFHLNIAGVKQTERDRMLQVLAKMNFDNSFELLP
jgi:hypothetical protein